MRDVKTLENYADVMAKLMLKPIFNHNPRKTSKKPYITTFID